MPIEQLQGLKGLPGLKRLSARVRDAFYNANKDILNSNNFRSPVAMEQAAEIMYNNKQFVNKFGQDVFNQYNNGTEEAYNLRNNLLTNTIIEEEWNKYLSPFNADGTRDNNKGLGAQWEKYSEMSPEGKLQVLESKWWTPSEFNDEWRKYEDSKKNFRKVLDKSGASAFNPTMMSLSVAQLAIPTPKNTEGKFQEFLASFGDGEGAKRRAWEENNRIIEHIYNDDIKKRTHDLGDTVSEAYYSPEIIGLSDDDVEKEFKKNFIDTDSDNSIVKLGAGELAAYWGQSELSNFGIDDMRKWLAKKKAYMQNMSPGTAAIALNNEAKEYITDHQGWLTRKELFAKDVGISILSYTADKVNGIYNLGLMTADEISGKPTVLMNEKGEIVDPNVEAIWGKDGLGHYTDENNVQHTLKKVQIARTTLHNMGKNFDGSDDDGLLNPLYWQRAEQFGTMDSELQKQYEQLGASPYKVAYRPNDDSDLWYESFKMMSFGMADALSTLIPFGVGVAGRALNTAATVGKAANAFTKAMNYTGKVLDFAGRNLSFQSKVGQALQGTAGALGIAYAYDRGAFQETLAQNFANDDEYVSLKAHNEIYNQYNTDKNFKKSIDEQINARAAQLKKEYIQQVQKDGGMQIADEKAVDKLVHARAQQEVLNNVVAEHTDELKNSKEFADLRQEAINSAGNTALTTFLPEAVKYGLVNNWGFRKFLYSNPATLTKKATIMFKGVQEVTTSEGRQRLTTGASKFLTSKQKWAQFGKTLGSQAWGGAWTNGTDDMMTDAAERINEDSYSRYLNAYLNGEAVADTYSLADGIYSYMKGFMNSTGQETTMNATIVGAVGSAVSASPNFANLAHLASKEGRQAYRDAFTQRYVRDENGLIQKNEDGTPATEKIKRSENWRERVNYFIQNGVLNTYYGKKQAERDLQNHADYVNNILDDYKDFEVLENLVASDAGIDNAINEGDKKTATFIKALHTINALNHLANDSKDPTTMSSVVQNAKDIIDNVAEMKFDSETDALPQDKNIQKLLSQYYAANPNIAQNENTAKEGLAHIIRNAKKLKEATEAYNAAEKEVQKAEKNYGSPFSTIVREKLKINHALEGHWSQRLQSMRDEIGDPSTNAITLEDILPSFGGKRNAQALVKVYAQQEKELDEKREQQSKEVETAKKNLKTAQKELIDNQDESKKFELQKKATEARVSLEDAQLQLGYIDAQISSTQEKAQIISDAITSSAKEGATTKTLLTANEIFALDPVARARMMRVENRSLYSKRQQKEIEKLEKSLTVKDADALQKIQDIALLIQRIDANRDAYNRVLQNPEAAAMRFEAQKKASAMVAYNLIKQRTVQTAVNFIKKFDKEIRAYADVSRTDKEQYVFKQLRRLNPDLLTTIEKERLLPKYQKQVADAKEWFTVSEDLDAAISMANNSKEWNANVRHSIDNIIESASSQDEMLANIEKAIDDIDNAQAKQDLDTVLDNMVKIKYQRDATVLENRRKRKEREEKEKKEREEKQKEADEAAQVAAAEEAYKQQEVENAQPSYIVSSTGEGLLPFPEITADDAAVDNVVDDNTKEEGERQDTSLWASSLMDDAAEAGTVETGTIWHKDGNKFTKGKFAVTRNKNGNINFSFNGKFDALTLNSKDWVLSDGEFGVTKEELEREGIDRDTPFRTTGLVKIKGEWYFNGKFDGHKEWYNLQASDAFNLDAVIERERETREVEAIASGEDIGKSNVKDDGDTVSIRSENIDEQVASQEGKSDETYVGDSNKDISSANTIGESNIEHNIVTLSGNAMAEYNPKKLVEDGILEHKKGASPNDSMGKFYAWMESAGIHLQNIIDNELAGILKSNPHAKVKFMAVKPEENATKDVDVQSHLFLVVDYDDNINKGITKVHRDANGGVVESQGKKYLIIGVAGYARGNKAKQELYDILYSNNPHSPNGYGLIKRGKKKFFDEHPSERFYIPQNVETEIVPMSLIPGYVVRQLEKDEHPEFRSVMELLSDEERNPHDKDLSEMAWGIQEQQQFLIVGTGVENTMIPRNPANNMGSAFVLIPAANGKMTPAYLRPLFYNEMQDGRLKDRVNQLLTDVVSSDYNTRFSSVLELSRIFYLDPQTGDAILLKKKTAEISLAHNGEIFQTFVLNNDFDRQVFLGAFSDMNPRVNITGNKLKKQESIKELDEAGALMTDVARLSTAGASYSIYGVDSNGKMIQPETPVHPKSTAPMSVFRNEHRSQVVLQHKYYTFENGSFYLNGIPVSDTKTIQQLEWNQRIVESSLTPSDSRGVWEYYILSQGENPEGIRVNRNTKETIKLSDEEVNNLIDSTNDKSEKTIRQKNAEEILKQFTDMKDVSLEGTAVLEDNGQLSLEEDKAVTAEGKAEDSSKADDVIDNAQVPDTKTSDSRATSVTQSFEQLYAKGATKLILNKLFKELGDVPKDTKGIKEYLRKKNIEVDAIGTSKQDIDAWVKTIRECR